MAYCYNIISNKKGDRMEKENRVISGRKRACATCQHCNKATYIDMSHDWRNLVAKYISAKEMRAEMQKNYIAMRIKKNGQIQALHRHIKQLLDLMDDKQREEAFKISQLFKESNHALREKEKTHVGRK